MGNRRIRPFNTGEVYHDPTRSNDFCQAVVAGNTVYLRGQGSQDLDTFEFLNVGDPGAQAEQAMSNIETLLTEAGGSLDDLCKLTVYVQDLSHRTAIYEVLGRRLAGVFVVSTGVLVPGFSLPECLVEIDAVAVLQ